MHNPCVEVQYFWRCWRKAGGSCQQRNNSAVENEKEQSQLLKLFTLPASLIMSEAAMDM